jgi:hypothetical protein
VKRRHLWQWQSKTSRRSPKTWKETAPQRHRPDALDFAFMPSSLPAAGYLVARKASRPGDSEHRRGPLPVQVVLAA